MCHRQAPSDYTGDKNHGISGSSSLLMNRVPRWGQLMYSSAHGTCDIEARDINNSGNATAVSVLHTSHGVNTSPLNETRGVEPTIKRKGAKDAIKALTSKLQSMSPRSLAKQAKAHVETTNILQSMSPRAFMRKQAKAHVDTPTCARQLMYSSTHRTCDIEARDINNSCNATPVLLQSMSPRAFMRKQAKAHVDAPAYARQLMYSSTYGTCNIEARDINNSYNATPVSVLHTSHGVNTSPSDVTRDKNRGILGSSSLLMNQVPRLGQVSSPASFRKHGKEESSSSNSSKQKACQQSVEPLQTKEAERIAIKALDDQKNKKFFREREAERWWEDNQQEIYKYYNVDGYINSV
ncbi:hypothetical protein Tco_0254931 [Tanacetum coccineum]